MGRYRKYKSAKALETEVEKYFLSITRNVPVTEMIATDRRDSKGHVIYEKVAVCNALGEPAMVTEYIVPPTVYDLCQFLQIAESTWNNYCDPEKHPEFLGTTTRARGRMRAWNEMQLLTRSGKDLKGIIFNLENNYGYKQHMEISGEGVEGFLRKAAEEEGGQMF